jgi:hypothetical protein
MRAQVRGIDSLDEDLDTYTPDDPTDVGLFVRILVGPRDVAGEESFDVTVCTPRWIERRLAIDGPLLGRHLVIIDRWNVDLVRTFLTARIEAEDAPTWPELGERIGRIGYWEFEDYRPR